MTQRTCIMGCPWKEGERRHSFPTQPKRRAEWCRILGIYPRVKHVFICGDHFNKGYIFGDRLSKFAKPNPPASRHRYSYMNNFHLQENPDSNTESEDETNTISNEISNSVDKLPKLSEEQDNLEETVRNDNTNDNNSPDEIPFLWDSLNNQSFNTDNPGKIETFEIRKGTTNDTIIKGRYVQTNDYLVVSYTPPTKWTLQEQVKKLDTICESQNKQIKYLNRELYRLRSEMKSYDKLLPKLRYLQTKNRCLWAALKIYKSKEAELRKKLKKKRKQKTDTNLEKGDITI